MLYDSYKGKDVNIYTIGNSNLEVDIIDMGARINAIRVFNKDVILGFSTIEDYLNSNSYAGATISRVANRIEDGRFSLNGQIYNYIKMMVKIIYMVAFMVLINGSLI